MRPASLSIMLLAAALLAAPGLALAAHKSSHKAASSTAHKSASHKLALRGRHHDDEEASSSKAKLRSHHGKEMAESRSAKGRHGSARVDDKPCTRAEIRRHRCEVVAERRPVHVRSRPREATELLAAAKAPRVSAPPPPVAPSQVILEDGQTLADVAAKIGVPAADLARLNGLTPSEEPPTGMALKLPPASVARVGAALASASPSTTGPGAGPRGYATLGPSSSGPVAPARTGRWSRTEADALAAYAVASARAPSLAGRSDATHNRFVWPLKGEVASGYGAHGSQRNEGLDFAVHAGDPVRAAAAGEVVYAGREIAGVGNLVLLKHADGWVTAYSHLGKVAVAMRQTVDQGQEVAEAAAGDGGTAPPVHFEVRQPGAGGAKPVDPATVLPAREGETGRG